MLLNISFHLLSNIYCFSLDFLCIFFTFSVLILSFDCYPIKNLISTLLFYCHRLSFAPLLSPSRSLSIFFSVVFHLPSFCAFAPCFLSSSLAPTMPSQGPVFSSASIAGPHAGHTHILLHTCLGFLLASHSLSRNSTGNIFKLADFHPGSSTACWVFKLKTFSC